MLNKYWKWIVFIPSDKSDGKGYRADATSISILWRWCQPTDSNYQKIISIDKSDGKENRTEATSISILCHWFQPTDEKIINISR